MVAALTLTVIIRAVLFLTVRQQIAFLHFIVVRVILKLLPAVTIDASIFEITSICISFCLLLGRPETALILSLVLEEMRLAPVVLPVVSIWTLISLMTAGLVIKRAPDCLKVEHVEVVVLLHLMK